MIVVCPHIFFQLVLVVNDDAVRLFYAGMSFVSSKENSPASDIIVNWEDKLIPLNAKLISSMLEIESKKGFNILVTTKSFLKGRISDPRRKQSRRFLAT